MVAKDPFVNDEELRIALVMNGGVSLAVWMGGVTSEIGCFVGESAGENSESVASIYSELRALMSTRVRVDIICGTSAGGINGTYLGLAIARHGQQAGRHTVHLRDVWIQHGALDALLRDPFSDKPPSILDGGGTFSKSIRDALDVIPKSTIQGRGEPLSLLVTTTLLQGARREISDVFGNRLTDVNHRGTFEFIRGESGPDPFAGPEAVDRLAVAARATASFPVAFEPHFVQIGPDRTDATKADMADAANFDVSGFVTDGGVLDNSPIERALDLIFKQRAGGPVRRILAFVIPDPAPRPSLPDCDPANPPGMLDVAFDTMVRIPRVQSVATQIEELREHNERVRQRRRDRILLTSTVELGEMERTAAVLFKTYRAQRVQSAVRHIVDRIDQGLSKTDVDGLGRRGRRAWLVAVLTDLGPSLPFVPTKPPGSDDSLDERVPNTWRWGALPVQHMARLFLDLVARTQRVANYAGVPRDLLLLHWRAAFEAIEAIERVRATDRGRWPDLAPELRRLLGGPSDAKATGEARAWLADAVSRWQTQPPALGPDAIGAGEVAHRISEGILSLSIIATDILTDLSGTTDGVVRREMSDVGGLIGYFLRNENDTKNDVLERLLVLEVIQEASGPTEVNVEQEVDYVQVSADEPTAFGGPKSVSERLTGLQLAHFGAFYKGSWRANDWMWGRLDAVRRLVLLLLDPGRMMVVARKWPQGSRAKTMASLIRSIALGPEDKPTFEVLKETFQGETIERELSFLDNSDWLMPERLVATSDAVIRRLHLEILTEELPFVARQIRIDTGEDTTSVELKRLLAKIDDATRGDTLDPKKIRSIMHDYCVGSQRLIDEVGTDRMAVVTAQILAVAIAALRRETGWFRLFVKILALLRIPTLALYVFLKSASRGLSFPILIFSGSCIGAIVIIATHLKTYVYPTWFFLAACALVVGSLLWLLAKAVTRRRQIIIICGCILLTLAGLYWTRALPSPTMTIGGRGLITAILSAIGAAIVGAGLRYPWRSRADKVRNT